MDQLDPEYGDLRLYFSHDFFRKHFRLDLSEHQFFEKLIIYIRDLNDLQNELLSPTFWIRLVDLFDSKYRINKKEIKATRTWFKIATIFFIKIYPNVSNYEKDESYLLKLRSVMDNMFHVNNFKTKIDPLQYLKKIYKSNIIKQPQVQVDSEMLHSSQVGDLTNPISQLPITKQPQAQDDSEMLHSSQVGDLTNAISQLPITKQPQAQDVETRTDSSEIPFSTPDINNNFDEEVQSVKDGNTQENVLNNSIDTQATDENIQIDNENLSATGSASVEKVVSLNDLDENFNANHMDSSDTEEESQSTKKIKFDSITDSLQVGKSKYFKKKCVSNQDFDDDVNDLKFLLRPSKKPTSFKGKKRQLRQTNKKPQMNFDMDDFDNASNDFDDNASHISNSSFTSRTSHNKLFNNKSKNGYIVEEDRKILAFIVDNGRYAEIKGNQLWKDMQEKHVLVGRSWQSMKERFRKTISLNLEIHFEMGHIDKKGLEHFQNNTSVPVDKNTTKNESLNALGNNYSRDEDEEILKLVSRSEISTLLGRSIWIEAEKYFYRQLNRKRTWQSLKERFIKRILPRIHLYDTIKSYEHALNIVNKCALNLDLKNQIKMDLKRKFKIDS